MTAAWALLAAFGASCIALLQLRFLREKSGFLQFPTLAGGGMFAFLFVQAVALVTNDAQVPREGLRKLLAMCTLCALAIYFASKQPTPRTWGTPTRFAYPLLRIYWTGIALLIVGAFGILKLASAAGGLRESFSVDNQIANWSGLPVVYLNIATMSQTGLVMVALSALRLRNPVWRLIPAIPFLILQVTTIATQARRFPLVWLATATICTFYLARRALPPKPILAAVGIGVSAAVFIFPLVRGYTRLGNDQTLSRAKLADELDAASGGGAGEFRAACYLIQITDSEHLIQYGAGLYNDLIRYWVPKLLVGEDGKKNLLLPVENAANSDNTYGWQMPNGYVPTGPASVFVQFGYLGAALFWLLARWMRYLWIRATQAGDLLAQCTYVLLVAPAMAAVASDFTGGLYPAMAQSLLVPGVALLLLRRPGRLSTPPYHWRPRGLPGSASELGDLAAPANRRA